MDRKINQTSTQKCRERRIQELDCGHVRRQSKETNFFFYFCSLRHQTFYKYRERGTEA